MKNPRLTGEVNAGAQKLHLPGSDDVSEFLADILLDHKSQWACVLNGCRPRHRRCDPPGAQSSFASAFREIVVPDLLRHCRALAYLLALDEVYPVGEAVTFGDAVEAVWDIARRRGAHYLPTGKDDDLRDWILTRILSMADEFAHELREHQARTQHVHEDINRWNEAVLQHFSEAA